MAFITALPVPSGLPARRTRAAACRRPTTKRTATWRAKAATGVPVDATAGAGEDKGDGEQEWRPHGVQGKDADDGPVPPSEMPVELAEGYLPDGGVRPKLDLDADEAMLMWKVRRMLHEDDFKKIFDNPRVGEL